MKDNAMQNINLYDIVGAVNNGCQPPSMGDFITSYGGINNLFLSKNRFFSCAGQINWPTGSGVYVIWMDSMDRKTLLYIGMTGTYRRPTTFEVPVINQETRGFARRAFRWTPYCFFPGHFSYGPNFTGNKKPVQNNESNYRVTIPISAIAIDFFVCGTSNVAPAFLEALLLQLYMDYYKDIPPANNAF